MPRPKKLVINKVLTDDETSKLEGKWIDNSYMKQPVINYNVDVYYKDDDGNEKLLLKFRRNSIKPALLRTGWSSYKDLAKPSRGRGASAGPIDTESIYWKKRNILNTSKWSTGYLNPVGNKLKEELEKLSIEEIKQKLDDSNIKYSDDSSKEDLIVLVIKSEGGISKMKVKL